MERKLLGRLASWRELLLDKDLQSSQNWKRLALSVAIALILGWILLWAINSFYKLYLHPLAKFPGPTAACLSKSWVLQISQTGHAEQIFGELHQKYNTKALRIAPNEIHINDVTLYKTIYNQSSAFLKDPSFYGGFGTPHTVFAEHEPALHKERRRILNPFFSRGAIVKLEPMLQEKVAELANKIEAQPGPYNIYNAIRCTTVDIISHYYTGNPIGQLQGCDRNFYGGFLLAFDTVAQILWNMVYHPHLRTLLLGIPRSIAKAMSKDVASISLLSDTCYSAALAYKTEPKKSEYPVILSALTHLSDQDVGAEAVDILVAGSDTTAFSLTVAIIHIAKSADIKKRLVSALRSRVVDKEELPSLSELESTEYLNACVKEAIRIASPVPGRLPRIVPQTTPLVVDGKVVPPGSVVGMSAYTMHHSRQLWGDDAASFNPDRWLGKESKNLEQYMVSFSKGLRSCLGQNLAYAEIHIMLAYLFRKYDVKLAAQDTTQDAKDSFTYYIPEHGLLVDLEPYPDKC